MASQSSDCIRSNPATDIKTGQHPTVLTIPRGPSKPAHSSLWPAGAYAARWLRPFAQARPAPASCRRSGPSRAFVPTRWGGFKPLDSSVICITPARRTRVVDPSRLAPIFLKRGRMTCYEEVLTLLKREDPGLCQGPGSSFVLASLTTRPPGAAMGFKASWERGRL
jgi:hypothetical protein